MNKQTLFAIVIALALIGGAFSLGTKPGIEGNNATSLVTPNTALAAKFETLSQNGNSSCSGGFKDSITTMQSDGRLQGSCCSPMDIHRYTEQVEGIEAFKTIAGQNSKLIPDDPYDIDVELAQELLSYYDLELTPEEQKAYDYAMLNSNEKGPCCCKCWRWYVYGGMAKQLIKTQNFTGEQITQLWNLSDGCGGPGDHVQH